MGPPGWHLLNLTRDWERAQGCRACSSLYPPSLVAAGAWLPWPPAEPSPASQGSRAQAAARLALLRPSSWWSRDLEPSGSEFRPCMHAEAERREDRST